METVMQKLQRVAEHQREESRFDGRVHADGCYYCGGNHPTDCCDSQDRDEFYEELR